MQLEIDPSLQWLLAITMLLYVAGMYAIGYLAQRRIHDSEDFLVAGRRLPLSLAWMTLLATWFGAGTLLTAADEVRREGLQAAALDPLGPGLCLLIAGWFFAGPMWRMGLLTVPEFFRRKFGVAAELVASAIMVPSYFGWIAAQFVALAGVLNLFFDIDPEYGLLLVAAVGTGYTLMGGMWSVTLTDAIQISLVLLGLIVLTALTLLDLGEGSLWHGFTRLRAETSPHHLQLFPSESLVAFMGWIGVLLTGALGNIPGQDLMQRVFASKSERTARWACVIAGLVYLSFGLLPLVLALAGNLLFPEDMTSEILPALAHAFLHPAVAVIFVVALLSAVLSTIDSAILSPASVLAENVLAKVSGKDSLMLNRISVLVVALFSLALAYAGTSAYELLEAAYLLTLVGLFVPLTIGLYSSPRSGRPALASMLLGTGVWAMHLAMQWEHFLMAVPVIGNWQIPLSLAATVCSVVGYFLCEPPWRIHWIRPSKQMSEKSEP